MSKNTHRQFRFRRQILGRYNAGGTQGEEAKRMDQPATKTCPTCGSSDYAFRGRKKIEANEEQNAAVETKYRCKLCGKEWKVRTAVV
jgi:transposase-like protein